jgi:hypothetical protein
MLRTDIWAAAFVRRHNDLGHLCVVARRGDPVAGQVFLEIDHLNGTVSLYTPAPQALRGDDPHERLFQLRFDHVEPDKVRTRIEQEQKFDPDLWVIALEMRKGEPGITLV